MSDYGLLVNPPVWLQRNNFKEMCKLLGVKIQYRYPLKNKQYTLQGELDSDYSEPQTVDCIFAQNIDQRTAKKLGWAAELQTDQAIIHLPYDLQNLQIGCLVDIPSAFDGAPPRRFRITELSAIQIYPASISCKLALEWASKSEKAETEFFQNTNFNLLNEENERSSIWK